MSRTRNIGRKKSAQHINEIKQQKTDENLIADSLIHQINIVKTTAPPVPSAGYSPSCHLCSRFMSAGPMNFRPIIVNLLRTDTQP